MGDPLRGHRHKRAIVQFPTPLLGLGPDEKLVDGHFLFNGD
jgi:hypothetical protein